MSLPIALCVAAGAAAGAVLRHVLAQVVHARHQTALPWGTFVANAVGCLLLGLLAGGLLDASASLAALIGTGFCGALTTYSAFALETDTMVSSRDRLHAALYVTASVFTGLGAATLGAALGAAPAAG